MGKLWQDLDKLMVFTVVADKGKINQAADALHLTQPSVSRSIQKLEEAFGAELFTRNREGVKLTRVGVLLYEKAARMLRELEDLKGQVGAPEEEISGSLVIGTYESLAEYLWPGFLLRLQKEHPHLHLSVKTSIPRDPLLDLIGGRIDLLVDAEPQISSNVMSWPIYSDLFAFYVAGGSKVKELTPETAASFNISFVPKAIDEDRKSIEDHLAQAGYSFARTYGFDSFSTARQFAKLDGAIAVLPKRLAEEDVKKKVIKPIRMKGFADSGFGRHTLYATVASEKRKDPRLKRVVALLKTHFR